MKIHSTVPESSFHHHGWKVQLCDMCLDFFGGCTVPVSEWVHTAEVFLPHQAWSEFLKAADAVSHHGYWDGQLREEPCVGYNPNTDHHYFIFKLDNNGTSYVVERQ